VRNRQPTRPPTEAHATPITTDEPPITDDESTARQPTRRQRTGDADPLRVGGHAEVVQP
jgi:hypothetical protein